MPDQERRSPILSQAKLGINNLLAASSDQSKITLLRTRQDRSRTAGPLIQPFKGFVLSGIETSLSPHCAQTGKMRDKPDLDIRHFADAASVCICGTLITSTRRKSPIRSFVELDFIRTETAFSLPTD